jgi:hypothetical protein
VRTSTFNLCKPLKKIGGASRELCQALLFFALNMAKTAPVQQVGEKALFRFPSKNGRF